MLPNSILFYSILFYSILFYSILMFYPCDSSEFIGIKTPKIWNLGSGEK